MGICAWKYWSMRLVCTERRIGTLILAMARPWTRPPTGEMQESPLRVPLIRYLMALVLLNAVTLPQWAGSVPALVVIRLMSSENLHFAEFIPLPEPIPLPWQLLP